MSRVTLAPVERTRFGRAWTGGVRGGTGGTPPTYPEIMADQAATSYWPMQAGVADGATEPDQIGSRDLTMTSGTSGTGGTGPLGDSSLQIVEADTEYLLTAATHAINTSWSFSMWVKMATNTSTVPILAALSDASASNDYIYIIHRDDRSGITLQLATAAAGAILINFGTGDRNIENDGLWHHIAVTRSYSTTAASDIITCYLDGTQVAQTTRAAQSWNLGGAAKIAIGDRYTGSSLCCSGDYAHAAFADGVVWTPTQIATQWAAA